VGDIPGHVVIPELSTAAYKKNKKSLNEIVVELAKLAGNGVVLRPRSDK
jgi:hypothetical protein